MKGRRMWCEGVVSADILYVPVSYFNRRKTQRHGGRGVIWWSGFLSAPQKYLFLAQAQRKSALFVSWVEQAACCVLQALWLKLWTSASVGWESWEVFNRPEYTHTHTHTHTHKKTHKHFFLFVFLLSSPTFSLSNPQTRRKPNLTVT